MKYPVIKKPIKGQPHAIINPLARKHAQAPAGIGGTHTVTRAGLAIVNTRANVRG